MIPDQRPRKVILPGLLVSASLLSLLLSLPIIRASSPTLLISEVLYDATGAEPDEEWIEIYNAGASAIDLSNYKVGDEEEQGGTEGMLQFPAGAAINPGQVILIANHATAFSSVWGFPPDYEIRDSNEAVPGMIRYTAWAGGAVQLANVGDHVLILDGGDAIVDAMSYGDKTTFFDPPCPDVAPGHSLERFPGNVDTDTAGDWIEQESPNPGEVTTSAPTATATATTAPTPTDTPTTTPTITPTVADTPITTPTTTLTPTDTPTTTPTPTVCKVYLPLVLKDFDRGEK